MGSNSRRGKERNQTLLSLKIKAPVKHTILPLRFTRLEGRRIGCWPLPSTSFPHKSQDQEEHGRIKSVKTSVKTTASVEPANLPYVLRKLIPTGLSTA
jgi:hypothetical protein